MIAPGAGVRVYLACGVTDMRKGMTGLQAEVVGMVAANRAYEALVQALKITIARLKKQRFGASSKKIEREIEQLELALE
jgi:transposase